MKKTAISGWIPFSDGIITARILSDLQERGFHVSHITIDIKEYNDFLLKADYPQYENYFSVYQVKNTFIEKSIEHFLAAKLLELSGDDIYIDVANSYSPVPDIYNKLYGCETYRQDIIFPDGINGNVIGGDAANMPLGNGFATKMGLHCSFEHFEGDADIRFIREASRVLKDSGRLCIVPLYLFTEYAIQTDTSALSEDVEFDMDAAVYHAEGWGERHGRFYDVPRLISRIKDNLSDLDLTIYVVTNAHEVDPSCYVKFAALFLKK